jgi:rsbT co-antagonist protein RsbR
MNEDEQVTEVIDRLADVLIVLSDVGAADYAVRLPSDLPEEHALGALYRGINEMIASLEQAQQRSAAYQKDLEDKLATIEKQRAAIRELSTPIIEIWEGVLCLPIVGVMDSNRSADMTESLLREVVDKRAECVIVDITGIEIMDTRTADHFIRMAKSVQLLGATCVLTGLNPGIALTITHMGIDMGAIVTYRSLRDALQDYVRQSKDSNR